MVEQIFLSPYSWMKYLLPSTTNQSIAGGLWTKCLGTLCRLICVSFKLESFPPCLFFIRAHIFLRPKRLSDLAVRLILWQGCLCILSSQAALLKLPMLCVYVAAICSKSDLSQMYVCVCNDFIVEKGCRQQNFCQNMFSIIFCNMKLQVSFWLS